MLLKKSGLSLHFQFLLTKKSGQSLHLTFILLFAIADFTIALSNKALHFLLRLLGLPPLDYTSSYNLFSVMKKIIRYNIISFSINYFMLA